MSPESASTFGILCALEGELGTLVARRIGTRRALDLELAEIDLGAARALSVVSGVGPARAAHAAEALLATGACRALLVVGTCGSLVRSLAPGDFVHCTRAFWSSGRARPAAETASDPRLRAAWRRVAPGPEAHFFTVERPVLDPLRRWCLSRSRPGPAAVDMETAAAASVAEAASVPWAALRVVTDRAGFAAIAEFKSRFARHGGRAADTLERLAHALA